MSKILTRIKRALCTHKWDFTHARNLQPDKGTRRHRDGTKEPIDCCDLVMTCRECGSEKTTLAPVSIAERHDVTMEWGETDD